VVACYGLYFLPFCLPSFYCKGKGYHPIDQKAVGCHFMFGGMIRGEINCSICCRGFSEYVDFYFGWVPDYC
jgi:hypothetical protein